MNDLIMCMSMLIVAQLEELIPWDNENELSKFLEYRSSKDKISDDPEENAAYAFADVYASIMNDPDDDGFIHNPVAYAYSITRSFAAEKMLISVKGVYPFDRLQKREGIITFANLANNRINYTFIYIKEGRHSYEVVDIKGDCFYVDEGDEVFEALKKMYKALSEGAETTTIL